MRDVPDIRSILAAKRDGKRLSDAQIAEFMTQDGLTPRELEILKLISAGNRNRDVAEILSITEDTVKAHVRHVLEKLGANDRTEAVVIALRRGMIQL